MKKIIILAIKFILLKFPFLRKREKGSIFFWCDRINLGDQLADPICSYLCQKNGISEKIKSGKRLLTVGSILQYAKYNDVIWGSGVLSYKIVEKIVENHYYSNLDIRAVRGPLTREVLLGCGYSCPKVYGDPAILMPLIYPAEADSDATKIAYIPHWSHVEGSEVIEDVEILDIRTKDYKVFISRLCQYKFVISESLHGIILAESYGIPAIFLNCGMDEQLFKFYDWYFSTQRYNVKVASTLQEALKIGPMELPDLEEMRISLAEAFPVDAFEEIYGGR